MRRAQGMRALVGDFARFAGARLWLAFGLMLAGAIAEGFGLIMIVPLAAVAIGEESRLPQFLATVIAAWPETSRLYAAAALFVGAMALRSIILFHRDKLRAALQADYQVSLQMRSAAALAGRGWAEASRIGQAGIQSLLLNDIPRVSAGVSNLLELAVSGVMLVVQLVLVSLLAPELTLFALVVVAPAFVLIRMSTRRLSRIGQAFVTRAEDSTSAGMRLHSGLKAALAQGTVPQFLREYDRSLRRLAKEAIGYGRDLAASGQVAQMGSALAAVALLIVGARFLDLPFATLAASLILFARMASPAMASLRAVQQSAAMAPAFDSIGQRLGSIDRLPQLDSSESGTSLDWQVLALADVTYRHPSGGGIEGISATLNRGQWLGLHGPSAAGKTTFVDLAACLIAPQSGSLSVDGAPLLGQRLNRWREGLAYVGQDGLVFADSVAGNLNADRAAASEEEMWRVLEMVGLAERIRAFDDGLEHPLGERGALLSGGERQRLLIARALLRRPTLIILDEATAALDPAAEAIVLGALRKLDSNPAAILVAHRESTLSHCDSVLAIQHGKAEGRATAR